MIGASFNAIESYLLERHGDEGLAGALAAGGFESSDPWLSVLDYPHAAFERWLAAAAAIEQRDVDGFGRDLARWAAPRWISRYTSLTVGYATPLALLADMGSTIYPQMRRMHGVTKAGEFRFHTCGSQAAEVEHASEHDLCPLIEGGLLGLGDHFGLPLQVTHVHCRRRGDACCRLRVEVREVQP